MVSRLSQLSVSQHGRRAQVAPRADWEPAAQVTGMGPQVLQISVRRAMTVPHRWPPDPTTQLWRVSLGRRVEPRPLPSTHPGTVFPEWSLVGMGHAGTVAGSPQRLACRVKMALRCSRALTPWGSVHGVKDPLPHIEQRLEAPKTRISLRFRRASRTLGVPPVGLTPDQSLDDPCPL
jgi:hypothetical protein